MSALDRLGAFGKGGGLVGRELDLARELGPRLAWTRLRPQPGTAMPGGARREIYGRIWREGAEQIGADVRELEGGFLEITRGGKRTRIYEQLVQRDDPVILKLAGDKPLSLIVLSEAGLPVPDHVVVEASDVDAAAAFLDGSSPNVVKPASGSGRGDGITGFVVGRDDLRRARLRALRYDPGRLLVERQAGGDEYRVLVMDGEVLGVVRREPPHVTGDGRSTVAELVTTENRRRAEARGTAGLWAIDLDLDAVFTLRAQGMTVTSVPAAGQRVRVRAGSSQGSELEAHVLPAGGAASAGIEAASLKAAATIDSRYSSIELMTPDASVDLAEAGGVVLEINTTPGVAQHYLVADPDAIEPVAARVLERLLC